MRRPPYDWAFLAGFSSGVVIGAAVGVIFAPRSGRESRRRVAEMVGQFPNTMITQYGRATDEIQSAVKQTESAVTSVANGLSDALRETKMRVTDAVQRGVDEAQRYVRESDATARRET
jgi:gas vesicle protein